MVRLESLDSGVEGGAHGREPGEQDGEDKIDAALEFSSVAEGCTSGFHSGPGRITTTSSISRDVRSLEFMRNGVSGNIERWKGTRAERNWSETSQSLQLQRIDLTFSTMQIARAEAGEVGVE